MSSVPADLSAQAAVASGPGTVAAHRRTLHPEVIHELLWIGGQLFDQRDGSVHASFAAWCGARPGQSCRLWIGSDGLVELLCSPVLSLHNPARRIDWARRQLLHYHGPAAREWRTAAWRCRAALGVSALRRPDDAAWMEPAVAAGVRVRGLHALWPLLLAAAVRERPPLRGARHARIALLEPVAGATADGAVMTLLDLQRGRLVALHRRRVAAGDGHAIAEAWAQSAGDSADGGTGNGAVPGDTGTDATAGPHGAAPPSPDLGLWIALGAAPDPATGAVDCARWLEPLRWPLPASAGLLRVGDSAVTFLPEASARDGWWAVAASALLLAGATWDAAVSWQQLAAARTLAATPAPAAVAAATTPRTAVGAPVRAVAVRLAPEDSLAYRWNEVFRAGELAAQAGAVRWLSFEHERGGTLRLQGVARDAEAPRRAVALLRRELGAYRAALARLERNDDGASFEIRVEPDALPSRGHRGPQ